MMSYECEYRSLRATTSICALCTRRNSSPSSAVRRLPRRCECDRVNIAICEVRTIIDFSPGAPSLAGAFS